ncbi:MAG: hypothetical protein OdinLCB4_005635 [Candidatus Odinarchaeum yellowstonii]|uniref:Uncharacterized protein n=1 Tax=Odinarchaeota yellowstonii (strain LCB_4) TaxID=1841599 RepID=A0AAF0D1K3_ODILC|nr:MAG: hypothetical protein OdinLCB4_005635 [Candidatus Odinarchaeum yellowstonii]
MKFFKKRRQPKEGFVLIKLCPVCGSSKLREFNFLSGWYTQLQYICEACGYSGPLFLEVEVEKTELDHQNNVEPVNREDNL